MFNPDIRTLESLISQYGYRSIIEELARLAESKYIDTEQNQFYTPHIKQCVESLEWADTLTKLPAMRKELKAGK